MDKNDIYEHISFPDAEIPFVLHSMRFAEGQSLGRHNWHESLEILYFTSGEAIVSNDFKKIPVSGGDVAVINSNTLHDIYAVSDMHFYCLIVDRAFCVANYLDTSSMLFDALVRDAEISALMDRFAAEYADKYALCRSQLLRSTALRILALLGSRYGRDEREQDMSALTFQGIKRVLGYIHSKSHTRITLDELAKLSGISKFYLAREFRALVGCTIVEYVNHVRCENAKRMLQEDQMSIANIAVSCGYPTPSYFTRTFLRETGIHPSEYKKQIREQKKTTEN